MNVVPDKKPFSTPSCNLTQLIIIQNLGRNWGEIGKKKYK
jgi:hypothetical protein